MADNIVESLFGSSPWQIQQQQNANLNNSALQYAQLDPFQRANMSMFNAGGSLAGLVAPALGLVNQPMQEAQNQDAAMAGTDANTPEGLRAMAQKLNSLGMQRQAFAAVNAANALEKQIQEVALSKAHAKYFEQGGARGGGTLANIQALSNKEMASKLMVVFNAANNASMNMNFPDEESRLAWVDSQVNRAKSVYMGANPSTIQPDAGGIVPQGGQMDMQSPNAVPLSPNMSMDITGGITPEMKQIMLREATSAGDAAAVESIKALPTTQNIPTPTMVDSVEAKARAKAKGEKSPDIASREASAKQAGSLSADSNEKLYTQAESANAMIPKLDRVTNEIESSSFRPGAFADFRVAVKKAQSLLGGAQAAKNASDAEIMNALMGQDVFSLMGAMGLGSKQMDTPAERDFMRQVLAGTISMERGALKRLAEIRKADAQAAIDRYNQKVDSGELDNFFSDSSRQKKKFIGGNGGVSAPTKTKSGATVSNW